MMVVVRRRRWEGERSDGGGVRPVEVRPTALQREHRGLKSMCC